MNGQQRSSIKRGLRVAIVLKEDQSTGRRTVGEVADILTPSEHHPRGIKVRLKDGRVGRVQEILGPAPAPPPRTALTLVILALEGTDGSLYARTLYDSPDGRVTALGLDSGTREHELPADAVNRIRSEASCRGSTPRLLLRTKLRLQGHNVELHGYLCSASTVDDAQAKDWDWCGWLSRADLRALANAGELSAESLLLLEALERSHG